MIFNIALNYSGRAEIVDAARRAIASGLRAEELDEERFAGFLYTAGQPDPDLLIRTSGEMRVSNYLLWQIAYSEIYVTDTLWPDFRRCHLLEAVLAYQKRERRYGGIPTKRSRGSWTSIGCRRTSPSSWTATVAGPPSATFPASKATARGSTPCATPSRRLLVSASMS